MASGAGSPDRPDPSRDGRADYDYVSDDVARSGLVDDLEARVDGEVRFDDYSRQLYATDASAYQRLPVGVVFPRSTDDVAAVMRYCARRSIPVLPRGGGTSLAGQTVNEAVVLDCSKHMDAVHEVDLDARTVTAGPGITLGKLNEHLAPHDLKFAPDPAAGDRSVLAGAIGNNSTGAHSLVYGKTDYYVESCEVVLADGTVTRFGEVELDELRAKADPESDAWGDDGSPSDLLPRIYEQVVRVVDEEADAVRERYPDLKRNVSGYDLDVLVADANGERRLPDDSGPDPDSEPGSVNLARLLAGSEGTLATITEATVSLEPIPETKAIALLTYDSLGDAMEDVEPILAHGPAAVEVMDDVLLGLARDTAEFADVVGLLPDGTDAVLLVEFYAEDDDHGRQQVADLVADRLPATDALAAAETEADPRPTADRVTTDEPRHASLAMEAHDADTRAKFWKMRKSGLPILLSRTSDAKHISFIEDCAVPAEHLPAYVAGFQEILERHDTFATFYAHAGPGVLHVRPLVNTKTVDGLAQMEGIAREVTDLVVEYGGSVSGEHGDGRARTQWNRKLYGDHLWSVFRDLKSAFDPDWLLNPGNVCGDHDVTEHLRFDDDYAFDAGFSPHLNWENENGFQGMVELCHGCGGCRGDQSTTGGVMCPTFRAADEEIQSTRGRANMLRAAMSGELVADEQFDDEFMHEVMDLCIGCKGCARDCPSEVDMAKLKAELAYEHHEREGASLRDRVFANIETASRVGSALAPLSNLGTKLPGARRLMERTLGIARDRELPTFHRETFTDWFDARDRPADAPGSDATAEAGANANTDAAGANANTNSDVDRRVLLFPDTYTNYNHPEAGKAAVRVLEAAGVHVALPDGVSGSGRPPFSKGFLGKAERQARQNVAVLAPLVRDGWDVVLVEPSDAVMFQSDYLDLLSGPDVETVARNTYGVMEYLDVHRLDDRLDGRLDPRATDDHLTYHGHCHQKATKKDHHAVGVLRRAGYAVDPLDSTCCGMAGSFGYEAEHYSMSKAIASILYDQVDDSPGNRVVAPGASCRSQLGEEYDDEPPHPIEALADALDDSLVADALADSSVAD